jgi:hypothetical protein
MQLTHGMTAASTNFATLQEKFVLTATTAGTLMLPWACNSASGNVIVKAGPLCQPELRHPLPENY